MDLISIEESACILGVSRQSIYSYIKKRLLVPIKKYNGRVFFERDKVVELLNANYNTHQQTNNIIKSE